MKPHILTLSIDPDDYDETCPNFWTEVELACPYEPSSRMPCAVWTPCGCEYAESELYDPDWSEAGEGPCWISGTGVHHYYDGEPQRPWKECWPTEHAEVNDLNEAAWDLNIGPGTYKVFPWCDDGTLRFDLAHWVANPNDQCRGRVYTHWPKPPERCPLMLGHEGECQL